MYQNAQEFFENWCKKYEIKKSVECVNSYTHKYYHTYRVVKWMELLCTSLDLKPKETDLAKTIAQFHDLGRFTQLEKHKVYSDSQTNFDHGNESVEILKKENWFQKNKLDSKTENIICFAIYNHNKMIIKPSKDEEQIFYAKLIRDADKLAIIEEFSIEDDKSGPISKVVKEQLQNHHLVNFKDIKTSADDAVSYLAFIFDLNFLESYQLIKKHQILEPYFEFLKEKEPKESLEIIQNDLTKFLSEKIKKQLNNSFFCSKMEETAKN